MNHGQTVSVAQLNRGWKILCRLMKPATQPQIGRNQPQKNNTALLSIRIKNSTISTI
ncbi:hypothetical protein D3C80_2066790 [compost metagenome]